SGERLRKHYPNFKFIQLATNTGYAAGNNVGISYALENSADYVLVLNNDVIVEPTFLEPMVEMAEHDTHVGIVTCKVYYWNSTDKIFSAAGKMNRWICSGVNKGSHLKHWQNIEKPCLTDFACGVLLLMRRSMLGEEGLFDERYFMYFEDVEYSGRINRDYKIAYTPFGVAYHKSGGGVKWNSYSELYLYYHTRNRFLVYQNENIYYKIYVLLFSFSISLVKSLAIGINLLRNANKTLKQLRSLWSGFNQGIKVFMNGY
ncbi:MAG TPA: glycosyltransferase family 2 protein, partial [Bacteroidota bacterium]|nr:glycosyltransferase family 2 protein [Bacteroidota bacterium]